MSEHDAPAAAEVRELLDGALRRPAAEGARIVTLHWLQQLQQARHDWTETAHAGATEQDIAERQRQGSSIEALHRVRVALRRLRASCREHRDLLRGSGIGRLLRALSKLQRATNAARDADVQSEWLEAESDGLPELARQQADHLLRRLGEGRASRQRHVSNGLRHHLDREVESAARRLSTYRATVRIGRAGADTSFASHLAMRIERSAVRLQRDLATLSALEPEARDSALHRVRIQLKRQRALLAPHLSRNSSDHASLSAWFGLATRGQDQLGAMRDAILLAARARYQGAEELAQALDGVALGHFHAFRDGWMVESQVILRAQRGAADVLRAMDAAPPPHGLPMEFERKFLLSDVPPEAAAVPATRIAQGWLPGVMLRERLRWSAAPDGTERFTRTVKLGPSQARIEVEEPTDRAVFAALWPVTAVARIRKRRHAIADGDLIWEIDVFEDHELVLAEVELSHELQAVSLPAWLAPFVVREVTGEVAYLNAAMARPDPSDLGPV